MVREMTDETFILLPSKRGIQVLYLTNKSLKKELIIVFHRLISARSLCIFNGPSLSGAPSCSCSPSIFFGETMGVSCSGNHRSISVPRPLSSMESLLWGVFPAPPQGPIRSTLVRPPGDSVRQVLWSGGCTRPRWGASLGPGSGRWSGSDASGHLWSSSRPWVLAAPGGHLPESSPLTRLWSSQPWMKVAWKVLVPTQGCWGSGWWCAARPQCLKGG